MPRRVPRLVWAGAEAADASVPTNNASANTDALWIPILLSLRRARGGSAAGLDLSMVRTRDRLEVAGTLLEYTPA